MQSLNLLCIVLEVKKIIRLINKMNKFNLTNEAAQRIKLLLKGEKKNKYFRISILGGGCSGFQYDFSFSENKNKNDLEYKEYGIKFLIDKNSIEFIAGGHLDYINELAGSYFKIENPNATANCGCGTSFSI